MINLIINLLASFQYIIVPTAELREQPTIESEIVSQVFFSEMINPLEENKDWVKVESCADKYQGWVKKGSFFQREDPYLENKTVAKVNRCIAHLYHTNDTVYGPILTLPFESRLEVVDESDKRWIKVTTPDGRLAFIQRGDVIINPTVITKDEMCKMSLNFLDLPYTWGGRSSFGYDCSGFVQMLYRQMGIALPRDSKIQINWDGFKSISFEELKPGDLIFFGNDETKIRHVGMYLGKNEFIHCTVKQNQPYIRISKVDEDFWNGGGDYKYRAARTLKSQ